MIFVDNWIWIISGIVLFIFSCSFLVYLIKNLPANRKEYLYRKIIRKKKLKDDRIFLILKSDIGEYDLYNCINKSTFFNGINIKLRESLKNKSDDEIIQEVTKLKCNKPEKCKETNNKNFVVIIHGKDSIYKYVTSIVNNNEVTTSNEITMEQFKSYYIESYKTIPIINLEKVNNKYRNISIEVKEIPQTTMY